MNLNLKRQGYYREMPHAEESDPSIKNCIGTKIDIKMKEKICNYLDSGNVLVACYGLALDVINPERGIAGCPSMLTDGVWVWPGDLSYYVHEYSLRLDNEFLETMIKNDWTIEQTDEIDYDNLMINGRSFFD